MNRDRVATVLLVVLGIALAIGLFLAGMLWVRESKGKLSRQFRTINLSRIDVATLGSREDSDLRNCPGEM